MIFLISVVYFLVFGILGFFMTVSTVGTVNALAIGILMGIAAYFGSLCGYVIGKGKR